MSMPAATLPARRTRHALGLPAGSIRAILALSILGLLWLMVWKQHTAATTTELPVAFIYLQFLMVLILAHFFSSHGHSIGSHLSGGSPLGLPAGTIRFLLLVGYGGLAYFLYHFHPEFEPPPQASVFLLLAMLLSAFFIGHYLTRTIQFLSGGALPFWFQDVQAWDGLDGSRDPDRDDDHPGVDQSQGIREPPNRCQLSGHHAGRPRGFLLWFALRQG